MRLPRLTQLDSTRIGRFEFCWYIHSFLTELVLIYPVFGIMMLESVSNFELSLLFVVWTVVAIPLEVPFGTLADRFDRRHLLAIAGLIECFCFVAWLVMPGFWGYLLGFVTWAVAGTLQSGTSESLILGVLTNPVDPHDDRLGMNDAGRGMASPLHVPIARSGEAMPRPHPVRVGNNRPDARL